MNNRVFVMLIALFLTVFEFNLSAQEPLLITEWEVAAIVEGKISDDWTPQSLPGDFSFNSKTAVMRSMLVIPSSYKGQKPALSINRFDEGWMLSLNGVLVSQDGLLYDSKTPTLSTVKYALLPEGLIHFDEPNLIEIVVYNDGGRFAVDQPMVTLYEKLYPIGQLSDYLNIHIYLAFALISGFIGIYYIMRFVMNRSDRASLFFALANFALTIYFLEMGAGFPTIPHQFFYRFSKAFLPLFFMFLTLFFLEYFDKFNTRVFRGIVIGVGILGFLLILILGTTSGAVKSLFNLTLLPGALELLLMGWISFGSVLKGNKLAIPVVIGVLAGLVSAGLDIAYVAQGVIPLFYAQGFGILIFDFFMFMTLAFESIQVAKNLDQTSQDNAAKTATLQDFISEMGQVSEVLAEMNKNLSGHVQDASNHTDELKHENTAIAGSVETQFAQIQSNTNAITKVLEDFQIVRTKLTTQDGNIKETSAITIEMLETFDSTVEDLKRTTEFTEHLRDETSSAEHQLKESTRIIENIQEKSKDITAIIDAMNEIAARTNLLAMNASIEAAHAGSAGKGFAVVAQEIKKLAANSATKAEEVIKTIDEISLLIRTGVESNSVAQGALASISGDTESALEQISGIYIATLEEKSSGGQIINAMKSLTDFSSEIDVLTKNQESSGFTVKSGLEELINLSQNLMGSVDRNVEGNADLAKLVREIEKVAKASAEESKRLNLLLAREGKE